jgi:hypothetical protein
MQRIISYLLFIDLMSVITNRRVPSQLRHIFMNIHRKCVGSLVQYNTYVMLSYCLPIVFVICDICSLGMKSRCDILAQPLFGNSVTIYFLCEAIIQAHGFGLVENMPTNVFYNTQFFAISSVRNR